jgi:hypothetical protein
LNLTNTQWILGFAFVILLLAPGDGRSRGWPLDAVILGLAGLTGPLALVFAPLFVGRAIWRPTQDRWGLAAVAGLTAAVQGLVLFTSGRLSIGDARPADVLLAQAGQRFARLVHLTVGDETGFFLATALAGLALFALAALLTDRQWPAATCAAAAMLVFVGVLAGLRSVPGSLALGGERYYSLPAGLLLWGAVLACRGYPRTAAALLAGMLWLSAPDLLVPPLTDLGWRRASACLDGPGPCSIPLNPLGWSLEMPAR